MPVDPIEFLHETTWADLPQKVRAQAELCALDLIGVAAIGRQTRLSDIICDHAHAHFGGAQSVPMLFDGRPSSAAGAALAGGMTIDAMDAHDGFNPVKGHIGCGLFPALLAFAGLADAPDGQEILTQLAIGYELGGRLGLSLHASVPDYHTSGAWIAVAVAALGARSMGLDRTATRHAVGIAEYHGPRSQMMRCIDHPTMLKDGSGWGAMAGVSAALLARDGFTGAPALTLEQPQSRAIWSDLGSDWLILQQYYKPYPICRWAQAPVEGVLALRRDHGLTPEAVNFIEVTTFHEATRLATRSPRTTEEAQYSTAFPCAAAMVRGSLGVADISEGAFDDPEIARLSLSLDMREDAYCNDNFPDQRYAKVALHLRDGGLVQGDYVSPQWTAEEPPSADALRAKFRDYAGGALGAQAAAGIEAALSDLAKGGDLRELLRLLSQPLPLAQAAE